MKHVVRDDADLRAGDGEADRLGADRDQDFFGAIFALVCDNGIRPGNSGGRGKDFHAGLFQVVLIGAVEPGDFAVFVFTQDRPFHRAGLGGGPAEGGRVGGGFGKVGGVDEKFFRHAAEVDAGSAEVLVFGEDDAGAGFGGEPPRAHAAAAAADDEEVAGLHFREGVREGGDFVMEEKMERTGIIPRPAPVGSLAGRGLNPRPERSTPARPLRQRQNHCHRGIFLTRRQSRRKNIRDLPRTRGHLKSRRSAEVADISQAKFRDDNGLVTPSTAPPTPCLPRTPSRNAMGPAPDDPASCTNEHD